MGGSGSPGPRLIHKTGEQPTCYSYRSSSVMKKQSHEAPAAQFSVLMLMSEVWMCAVIESAGDF